MTDTVRAAEQLAALGRILDQHGPPWGNPLLLARQIEAGYVAGINSHRFAETLLAGLAASDEQNAELNALAVRLQDEAENARAALAASEQARQDAERERDELTLAHEKAGQEFEARMRMFRRAERAEADLAAARQALDCLVRSVDTENFNRPSREQSNRLRYALRHARKISGDDPAEVHPSDSRAESQTELNGPSGSPTSSPEPVLEALRLAFRWIAPLPAGRDPSTATCAYVPAEVYERIARAALASQPGEPRGEPDLSPKQWHQELTMPRDATQTLADVLETLRANNLQRQAAFVEWLSESWYDDRLYIAEQNDRAALGEPPPPKKE